MVPRCLRQEASGGPLAQGPDLRRGGGHMHISPEWGSENIGVADVGYISVQNVWGVMGVMTSKLF